MIRQFDVGEVLAILAGMGQTIALSAIAFACGGVAALLVALARASDNAPLRAASSVYIGLFQGTPLLMQLFMVFYGLPVLGIRVGAWTAVTVGLTLHASAFLGDIWRGGIGAVSRGQTEAAKALGLGYVARMRTVILPQAARLSLGPSTGFLVQLVKGTSLASIIGFVELSRAAQIVSSVTYKPLLAYGLAGLFYFAVCFPLSRLGASLERRFPAAA